ncbi:phosphate acetyltransferase [Dysgonomonas sp. PH5-45]|uniref:phosphate acetyltransferase n=1 Tax=unclassified Dysgonomonas TaxID=2630389 RepID=UPI002473E44C|nr:MULTISPECIES: phosphate acetyltransferase [unclassified Dysgonomonas]MDH6355084.1 phosphate acetyltransferase [Dysgonomonas sp. PH5-45]MDH6387984.1 phosphate acetyltransferase [Dysgonomonas sp. PH5-37]
MDLIQEMIVRAKADKQSIVLPEGTEERTLRAADRLIGDGVANITLLGNPDEVKAQAASYGLKNIDRATIIDPKNHAKKQAYIDLLVELRKSKGLTPEQAAKLVEDPLYLACLMIKAGDADGEVAGAMNATGNVLRPALQIIKTVPGISVVSGVFLMFTKTPQYGKNGLLLCADCAVTPNPTAAELAQIAVCTGNSARTFVGEEPRVAMLSFSTKGSAKHEMVDKVVEATRLARELDPTMLIDGELQADAALVPSVGASKAPGSEVAGRANVLVFPTLEVGNIAYKLVQRLGEAEAVGPVLQGMAAPVNDLSRGCSVDDIYKLVAITANQAIAAKKK